MTYAALRECFLAYRAHTMSRIALEVAIGLWQAGGAKL